MRNTAISASLVVSLLVVGGAPATGAGPADAHRRQALAAAAPTWQRAYDYLCEGKDRVFNSESDPLITPRWLFDDLGVIGDRGDVLYVLKTADGAVLFDTGYASKTRTVIEDGLKALGVDPKLIKTVLVSHGHPDHFGGAAWLQNTVGPNIWAGAADWPAIEASGVRRGGEAVDGGVVEQGGVSIRTFAVPGHTAGSLAFIFPVHDHGRRHTAALMGGLILGLERATPAVLQQYIASLTRLRAASQTANVDVELVNHPIFDNFAAKLEQLDGRKAGAANPFVVGTRANDAFLTVNQECASANLSAR
jgi:metallo-beta-lactamase class B